MFTFRHEPLHEILPRLRAALQLHPEVQLRVPDPDLGWGLYPGERTAAGIHRPYQSWTDVADLLDAQLLTPQPDGELVQLRFRRLPAAERRLDGGYGAGSEFARIDKLEDPWLLQDLGEALERAHLQIGDRVLALGVGQGRELDTLPLVYPDTRFEVLGLDLDDSALATARQRHPQATFLTRDVRSLPDPDLGHFRLILALNVLQSPSIDTDTLLRALCREQLQADGTVIVGFPNCRYSAGAQRYGARMLNFRRPDLSLLIKDVAQTRRYLQKHGFTVYVTGKYEVLVTGVRRG
ncbi:class I SAM-dependent methyltransferase [Deinococcus sonorensis]|uniref:Class I SAM-dependent methyltransferase n=2 Tax=Deinococcus sonorensis TaxID=309891 RepID=A0AAU7UDX2_9DEIO